MGVLLDRFLKTAGNGLAHVAQRDVFECGTRGRNGRAADDLLDVFLGDLSALSGALEAIQADTVLASKALSSRSNVRLTVKGCLQLSFGRVLFRFGGRRRGG